MNKKKEKDGIWIDMRLHSGKITIDGWQQNVQLPKGCVGILFAFKTKGQAKKFGAKDLSKAEKSKK